MHNTLEKQLKMSLCCGYLIQVLQHITYFHICDYEYDIITAPSNIGEHKLTDEEGEIFEKKLGESLLEILWETANNENRNSNTEELITK